MGVSVGLSFLDPALGLGIISRTMLGAWDAESDLLNAEALAEERARKLQEVEAEEKKLADDLEKLMSDQSELVRICTVIYWEQGLAVARLMLKGSSVMQFRG